MLLVAFSFVLIVNLKLEECMGPDMIHWMLFVLVLVAFACIVNECVD